MKECIILAGGLGTRLQSVVKDVPKCMAEVAGKPFMAHLFEYLANQHFDHVILALGYQSEIVIDWLSRQKTTFNISYVIEKEALGTGGAIKFAFEKVKSNKAFVINGDTFFDINTSQSVNIHQMKFADITIVLKPLADFDRYGTVHLNDDDRVIKFDEKKYCKKGLINGGIYLINKELFNKFDFPQKFSFEKDILESKLEIINIYGDIQNSYFIDIGIPRDFEQANKDLAE